MVYRFTIMFLQEVQLMLTNPRDAFRGTTNMVPFDMLGMVSY